MSISGVAWPTTWRTAPLWSMFRRVKDVGHPEEEMLSVYREHGVVRKESREDNFNKTAENRNIYQLVDDGWLIVNRMKAWQGSLGLSSYRGIVSGHYICFEPTHHEDSRFLNYLLRSSVYRVTLQQMSRGVRPNQIEIDNDELRALPVHLPGLADQRAIADYLDAETARIDALIAKKQQLVHLLEERWDEELARLLDLDAPRVALQRLFEPTIGGSWGSEPGSAEVEAHCVRGTDFDMDRLAVKTSAPVRAYSRSDFASKALRKGDLIVEKSGGGENQPVGRVVQFDGSSPALPTNFAARLRPTSRSAPTYLTLLLNAAYRRGVTRAWIKQTTGIQNLDLGGLLSEKVPLPSFTEQEQLIDRLTRSSAEKRSINERISRQIELIREHRQALITAAVTGEFIVPGAA